MVRRSFRGREDQLHRGNCLQLGQDSLQGEGFPQGGPLVGGRQLLEKQKEGKKKMRSLGSVQIPTEAFLAVLKLDE